MSLIIKSDILNALLLNLLSLNKVSTWGSGTAFVYELYRNGYLESAAYYAQGTDHPDFCVVAVSSLVNEANFILLGFFDLTMSSTLVGQQIVFEFSHDHLPR